eukprot:568623-Amphidinium_carterae.1
MTTALNTTDNGFNHKFKPPTISYLLFETDHSEEPLLRFNQVICSMNMASARSPKDVEAHLHDTKNLVRHVLNALHDLSQRRSDWA